MLTVLAFIKIILSAANNSTPQKRGGGNNVSTPFAARCVHVVKNGMTNERLSPQPDAQGLMHSRTFPGLSLDVAALLALDAGRVLDALEASMRSPAHVEFVARLKSVGKLP